MATQGEEADDEDASSSEEQPSIPEVVHGRFDIKHSIGSGSYSDVHIGVDRHTGQSIAAKFEWQKAEKTNKLLAEAKLYENFADSTGQVPRALWHGSEGEYNIMVTDLLGLSLEDHFKTCGRRFGLKTVSMLAMQMIDRLDFVHALGILHRDIKPQNFLMGLDHEASKVYIIDFGLSKRYRDPVTDKHVPMQEKKGMTGTVRYTSMNLHDGLEPSRRDDLISTGYVLMYFNLGKLPWQGIDGPTKKVKQKRIGRCKQRTGFEDLCKGVPNQFLRYFTYCDALSFEDKPDYAFLKQLFVDLLEDEGFQDDGLFDWMASPPPIQVMVDAPRASMDVRTSGVVAVAADEDEYYTTQESEESEEEYEESEESESEVEPSEENM